MHSFNAIVKALEDEGLKVVIVPGAQGRCRCHNGPHKTTGPLARAYAPTGDVMVHITAGERGGRTVLEYIRDIINGDPNVPMKSQFVVDYDGTVYVNSTGRCNHAGSCGSSAIAKSRAQSMPFTGYTDRYRGGDSDGNVPWMGIENIAAHTMKPAQRDASVRICAAMGRLHGRTGRGTIGHGEASNQRGYADPNLNMGQFRRDVVARIRSKPSSKPEAPAEPVEEKDHFEMSTRNEYRRYKDVPLKKGAHQIPIGDTVKGDTRYSVVAPGKGDLEFDAQMQIGLTGLPVGEVAQVRLIQIDENGKIYHRWAADEIIGTAGLSMQTVRLMGHCKDGNKVRVEVVTSHDGVVLDYCRTTVRHWR